MPGKKTNPSRVPSNAILLSKVSSLTLRAGRKTASRRVDPVPQLECVGPKDVCKLYQVDTMRCINEGADYDAESIQWSCKASLPDEFKLGSTDVICEGYESSDDLYVLRGSCGVEYRLLLTDRGEQNYGRSQHREWNNPSLNVDASKTQFSASVIFFLVFAAVLLKILHSIWTSWNRNPPRLGSGRGWGGSGNDDDPPPPYDGPPSYYNQPRKAKTQSTNSRPSTSTRASSSRSAPQAEQQGGRSGFWTGTAAAAAGAAAGYYAGRRGQTQASQPASPRQPETQQRAGTFWNSFTNPQGRGPRAPEPSSPPASFSSTRHESTGFGETRRR